MSRFAKCLSQALITTFVGCSSTSPAGPAVAASMGGSDQDSVVVELFTSQGCSSCPPADRLLAELKHWAADQKAPVVYLSFHVDYWNQLGWEDPYSTQANSERQRNYATALGEKSVYTPQMIVNGRQALVGSKRDQAVPLIKAGIETALPLTVKLSAIADSDPSKVKVLYEVAAGELKPTGNLNIALVENSAHNSVPRGENAGTESTHVNVVRLFHTVAVEDKPSGQVELQLPPQLAAKDCEVIAYVQNEKLQIQGATHFSLADRQANRVSISDAEWQKRLTSEQFHVTRQEGTERPFTGKLLKQKGDGVFTCICCGAPLFDSATKFESGTGWPSFWQPTKDGDVENKSDNSLGMARTEVICNRCGAHLGHVFDDGPKPTGLRYCINSAALSFIPADKNVASTPGISSDHR